jgi:hypothetical protein
MYGGRAETRESEQEQTAKVKIVDPKRNQSFVEIGRIPGNEKVKVSFKLQLIDIESTPCTIKYISTRGGVRSKEITIGK